MTAPTLYDKLIRQIQNSGPISVSEFMGQALMDPTHGYYATRDPFGAKGDFITAPEISQMFGELIGLWAAQCWIDMGRPSPFHVIELGPGRGTLQSDFQRAIRSALPDFWQASELHLIEASDTLKTVQSQTLDGKCCHPPQWHERLEDCPDGPFILIANEFFDALPICQYIKSGDGWYERLIGLSEDDQGPHLRFVRSQQPITHDDLIPSAIAPCPDGAIVEICPAGQAIAEQIADRAAQSLGIALLIDYGHAESADGDTLQALKAHQFADVLATPGEADLTAHVDFAALNRAAQSKGALTSPVLTQSAFLKHLGIEARAQALATNASASQKTDIETALARLIEPDQMGTLFKVTSVRSKHLPEPPGFAVS